MVKMTKAQRTEIADAALETAEEYADAPLLPLEELLDMSREEIDAYLQERGVVIDWDMLEADVRRALGTEVVQMNRGVEMTPARQERLAAAVQKATAQSARLVANKIMGDIRHEAMKEADPRPEDEQTLMWVSMEGRCTDCESLHGTIFQRDYWDGHSPRDGETVCTGGCRCSLIPVPSPGAKNEGLRNEEARRILKD